MLGLITVNQLKIYMSEVMMMIITAKPILSQYAICLAVFVLLWNSVKILGSLVKEHDAASAGMKMLSRLVIGKRGEWSCRWPSPLAMKGEWKNNISSINCGNISAYKDVCALSWIKGWEARSFRWDSEWSHDSSSSQKVSVKVVWAPH